MVKNEPQNHEAGKSFPKGLEWQIDTPLFDRFVVLDMLKLLAICAFVLGVVALLSTHAFILILLTIFFSILLFSIIFRSRHQVRFRVDSKGAGFITPTRIKGANKVIGYLLMLLGISNGRLGAFILGRTAASQPARSWQGWGIYWNDVRRVVLYPRERVVTLKERWFTGGLGGGLTSLRLYCTPKNYELVAAVALKHAKRVAAHKKKEGGLRE